MSRAIAPFGLRMPPELKKEIEESAKRNKRSLNAEIVDRLEETFRQDKFLPEGLGHGELIAALEEEISKREDLETRMSREYGTDFFDAMKDEIIAAIRSSK